MRKFKVIENQLVPGISKGFDPMFTAVFEESPDALFLLHPATFAITSCNQRAVELFQAGERGELAGRESFSLYDAEPVAFSKNTFIETVTSGKTYTQELAFRSLQGHVFWGKCFYTRVDTVNSYLVMLRIRRVIDYLNTAEILSSTIKHTAKVTGIDFFQVLTELLAKSFGVRMAVVGSIDHECHMADVMQTWYKTASLKLESFSLTGTAIENLLQGYATFYPVKLREMFGNDKLAHELDMESFLGTPVFDSKGRVSGFLALMDDKPMEEIPNSRYILSLFASRVGAELERMQVERSYRNTIENLQLANRVLRHKMERLEQQSSEDQPFLLSMPLS